MDVARDAGAFGAPGVAGIGRILGRVVRHQKVERSGCRCGTTAIQEKILILPHPGDLRGPIKVLCIWKFETVREFWVRQIAGNFGFRRCYALSCTQRSACHFGTKRLQQKKCIPLRRWRRDGENAVLLTANGWAVIEISVVEVGDDIGCWERPPNNGM
jgi:hypothetical protein